MTFKSPTFFTSDWHLFHAKSIEFDNRPFSDLEHMHRVLINNFNATVPENGRTFFLGDMGCGNPDQIAKIVNQLNGTKIFILGNHDKSYNAMYRCGFDVVLHEAVINIARERVTMTHCPLRGITREYTKGMRGAIEGEHWHGESRHKRFAIDKHEDFHLHGHIHSPNGGKSKKILGRQFDVGVISNKYRPVSSSEIESWIARTKKKELQDAKNTND